MTELLKPFSNSRCSLTVPGSANREISHKSKSNQMKMKLKLK